MRVHHLNCGTMCPYGKRLFGGEGPGNTMKWICHCLLIESPAGLVLVDTGFGLEDIADRYARLGKAFVTVARLQLDPSETAVRQIEALGYTARDVRHIVI